MSSILDALNKLEDEREREVLNARAALDAELAARDLMGEGDGPRYTVSLGPIALAAAGIALVLVVGATAALVSWLVRAEPANVAGVAPAAEVAPAVELPSPPPTESASVAGVMNDGDVADEVVDAVPAPSEPEPAEPEPATNGAAPSAPLEVSASGWAQALALNAGVSPDTFTDGSADDTSPGNKQPAPVRDVPAAKPESVVTRQPADPEPAGPITTSTDMKDAGAAADLQESRSSSDLLQADAGPVVVSPPEEETAPAPEPSATPVSSETAITTPPPAPEVELQPDFEVAAKPAESTPVEKNWPEDIRELPALSPAAKAKLGLEDFVVNMPMPATNARPVASAIINRMKVYKNERVLNTRVRLIDVSTHGVAIEVIDTGERYYVRH